MTFRVRFPGIATVVGVVLAAAPAGSRTAPVEPVRRDARIEIRRSVAVPELSLPSVFISAGLIVPRETTRELAAYARGNGPMAAKWLCDNYADASGSGPGAADLRLLIEQAAPEGEFAAQASDALVCPRVRQRVREVRSKLVNPGCLFDIFGSEECHWVRYSFMSHELAYPGCAATEEQRQAFGSAVCQTVLLGRSGRATAFKYFTRRAARTHACLVVSLSAVPTPSVQLARRACE